MMIKRNVAYFIGGPFDLTKDYIPETPRSHITKWTGPRMSAPDPDAYPTEEVNVIHHQYKYAAHIANTHVFIYLYIDLE